MFEQPSTTIKLVNRKRQCQYLVIDQKNFNTSKQNKITDALIIYINMGKVEKF